MFGFTAFSQAAYADDGVVNVAVSLTGVAGNGEVGTAEGRIVAFAQVTGVEATGGVGQIEAPNTGVILTGSAATGQVNNLSIIGDANFTPIGPFGTGVGEIGTVSIAGAGTVSVTGVFATGAVGSVTVEAGADVPATGIEATGAVGSVTVVEGQGIDVPVTGIAVTGAVGSVTIVEGTGINVDVTGVSATGQAGSVTIAAGATAFVTGVSATGSVKPVLVWGRIVPDPGTTWTEIAA